MGSDCHRAVASSSGNLPPHPAPCSTKTTQQCHFFVLVKTEPEREIYVIFWVGGKRASKRFHLILKLRKGVIKAHKSF